MQVILIHYRSYMAKIFNNYGLGKIGNDDPNNNNNNNESVKIKYRQGRYWIVFLQVFAQSLLNVPRQRPEELNLIGINSLQKCEAYINGTTSKIEVCLRNVLGQYSKWNAPIQPETVAEHLIAQ